MSFFGPGQTITFDAALRDLVGGSKRARVAAAQALGDLTDETEKARATEALMNAIDDDDPALRAEACASLGELGSNSAILSLIRRLDDGVAGVRQAAAIALGTLGHADGFAPLATALRDGPADLRFQAATSLAEIDPVAAFEPLVAALGDRDPQVLSAAALALGALENGAAVGPLATLLEHADAAVRFDAAYALAQLGDGRGRSALRQALTDAERAWDAVIALEQLGTESDASDLAGILGNQVLPPEILTRAATAILRLPARAPAFSEARAALTRSLGHRRDHVRGLAIDELRTIPRERVAEWAVPLLLDLQSRRKGRLHRAAIDEALAILDPLGKK